MDGQSNPARRNRLAAQARSWLYDEILPWWTANAWDSEYGGFHEAFDADLKPITSEGKRCFVQARQVAVFAALKKPELAQAGFEWMREHYLDDGWGLLWRHRVERNGALLPGSLNMYDQVFALLAMAAVGEEKMALKAAKSKGAVLRERSQNPYMHCVEACLAWFERTGEETWRTPALAILELCRERFVVDGFLREHFTDDWQPDPEPGHIVEPGHMFEWVWLIHEYTRLTGDYAFEPMIRGDLYHNAHAGMRTDRQHLLGAVPYRIGVHDSVRCEAGEILDDRYRLWPQCEALKAHAARWTRYGGEDARTRMENSLSLILRNFRNGPAWHEWLSPAGVPADDGRVPASSLYHLVGALNVVLEAIETYTTYFEESADA